MTQFTSNERKGLTGPEAAIILIAFVVIAAIFVYMVPGTGFTPQKSPDNRSGGDDSPVQVAGNVYGLAAVPSSGINEIRFFIRLVPGAPAMNLTTMKIVFSTPATSPVMLSQGATASTSVFTTRLNGAGDSVDSIDQHQQIEIDFFVADVPAGTGMNFDLIPPTGVLTFTGTTPKTITRTNIL
jgi:flagellin FlaB